MAFALRPHQVQGIADLRECMKTGLRRLILEIPTGGGKTEVAIDMIRSAVAKGSRVLFVVNRVQLLEQTVTRFEAAGLSVGVYQAANTRETHRRVLVASIQTITSRKHFDKIPSDIGLVVFDEAHAVGGGKSYHRLMFSLLKKAPRTAFIGLTATPWAKGMAKYYPELDGPLFQSKVAPCCAQDLIDAGFLVDADIYAPYEPDMTGVRSKRDAATGEMEYDEDQAAERMNQPKLVGDIVTTWLKLAGGKKTVVFASNIAHSQAIAESFNKCGILAKHLDYRMEGDEKRDLLKSFDDGEFTVLCNPLLLREGWDCPSVEVLVMARPTRSMISYIQIVGRVLRTYPGKERAIVLDHSGTCTRLGFPTDDRRDVPLNDGKPQSASAAEKTEREELLPKACPVCSFLKPAGKPECPACGHTTRRPSTVEMEDGELSLMKKSAKHRAIEVQARYGSKQQVYSMLIGYAQEKGKNEGAAYHQFKKLFGVEPRKLLRYPLPPSPELRQWITADRIRYAKAMEKKRSVLTDLLQAGPLNDRGGAHEARA
jgi:DNA repair protein RadD